MLRGASQYCGLVQFGVLGPLIVWQEDGEPVTLPSADLRSLLAVLLVHEGAPVPVERLVHDLWPQSLPARPANDLQVRVFRLRRALGSSMIEFTGSGYRLNANTESIDASRFQTLVTQAQAVKDPFSRSQCSPTPSRCGEGTR